ncbi:unnamed protein product [Linum tenue]|uniref:NADP-dependent oxidoreductase domain-containing protein n=1 Tax=Linum tenue TaxID=586396 RepID=A0AAV0LE21_9ROSI|nr:unnamed protein product [Linum tenue]
MGELKKLVEEGKIKHIGLSEASSDTIKRAHGDDVVPIPGTTKLKNLASNMESLRVKLTKEDVEEISAAVPVDDVAGVRSASYQLTWKFADTPLPSKN